MIAPPARLVDVVSLNTVLVDDRWTGVAADGSVTDGDDSGWHVR